MTTTDELPLTLSDLLTLISRQAQTVSQVAEGLMTRHPGLDPEMIATSTVRLTEVVNMFMRDLEQARAESMVAQNGAASQQAGAQA